MIFSIGLIIVIAGQLLFVLNRTWWPGSGWHAEDHIWVWLGLSIIVGGAMMLISIVRVLWRLLP